MAESKTLLESWLLAPSRILNEQGDNPEKDAFLQPFSTPEMKIGMLLSTFSAAVLGDPWVCVKGVVLSYGVILMDKIFLLPQTNYHIDTNPEGHGPVYDRAIDNAIIRDIQKAPANAIADMTVSTLATTAPIICFSSTWREVAALALVQLSVQATRQVATYFRADRLLNGQWHVLPGPRADGRTP